MKDDIAIYNKISLQADIKITPFDVSKRYTKPHRHNKYLELVYFTKGTGYHHVDSKSFRLEPPVVFLVKKMEVHNWEIDTIPKGYVIIIKENFLDKTLDKYINTQLLKLNSKQMIQIPQNDVSMGALFESLCWEMEQPTVQIEAVEGGLKALLTKIVGYSKLEHHDMVMDRATEFISLLEETLKNSVSFYAAALHTTPQNLNLLCQKKYNKTASQVIADQIVKEAKRLLLYTDKSINEIAFELYFRDSSHFVKYFKRHTKKTPLQFKQEI
ncbi:MAG: helix-turn-helix domain-containing protein [Maribacter sp.]|nr:helix-turn-helix domain-containing protein [Maribacter sp.]